MSNKQITGVLNALNNHPRKTIGRFILNNPLKYKH